MVLKLGNFKSIRTAVTGLAKFVGYPIISGIRKSTDSNSVRTFIGWIGTKAHEKFWKSSRGRSQGVLKIFRALV